MLYEFLKTLARSPRFYLIFVVIAATGTTIRLLPVDKQQAICAAYEVLLTNFQQLPATALQDASAAGDAADRLPPGQDNRFFVVQTRNLFCNPLAGGGSDGAEAAPPGYLEASLSVVPIAFGLSVLLCGLLPAGAREVENAAACSGASREPSRPAACPTDEEVQRLNRDLARARHACGRLSLQARQMNVALVYAVASCVATVFFRPSFDPQGSIAAGPDLYHVVALFCAAAATGAWGAHCFYRARQDVLHVSAQVGFAGVFFGGLIALCIALPYRLLTPVEAAAMDVEQVRMLALVRLLALPLVAGVTAAVWLTLLRAYHRLPVRCWPSGAGANPAPGV